MGNSNSSVARQATVIPLTDEWFREAKVSDEAKDHLLRSLKSLEKERAHTPSFKLYGSVDAETLIKRFLNSVPWNRLDVPKGWKEYELDRLKKVGPQGGHPSWEEMEPLFMLYAERPSPVKYVDSDIMSELQKEYESLFKGRYITPLNPDLTLAQLLAKDKIADRAAGCRDFNLKKTDIVAQRRAVNDLKSGLYKLFRMYVFERFNKKKPRIFMPGPYASMIDQARYCVPKLEIIKDDILNNLEKSLFYQFADKLGFDVMYQQIMPRVFEEHLNVLAKRISNFDISKITILYIQGDFEKMDTTMAGDQYEKLYIDQCKYAIHKRYWADFSDSMMQTTSMPIISPSGVMIGNHGTGSGMENTNDGESNGNRYYKRRTNKLFAIEMAKRLPYVIYEFAGDYENGDDSTQNIIFYDITPRELELAKGIYQSCAERAASECGFRINDKWRMDTNFGLYNQYGYWFKIRDLHHVECKYMYPATLVLNSIINPEKEYTPNAWDKDYRDLDVTEKLDNGRGLPYFTMLVDYVDNGMKYRLLGKSEKETRRILSKYDRYRALQDLSERFNRQDYTITNSATLSYLMEKHHLESVVR